MVAHKEEPGGAMSSLISSSNNQSNQGKSTSESKYIRFWVLVSGLMFFFGCHNFLQELIMSLPGFKVLHLVESARLVHAVPSIIDR
jgi:hypothetical protein